VRVKTSGEPDAGRAGLWSALVVLTLVGLPCVVFGPHLVVLVLRPPLGVGTLIAWASRLLFLIAGGAIVVRLLPR
jgi:hypothetical protein